jgi:hypothetical protein
VTDERKLATILFADLAGSTFALRALAITSGDEGLLARAQERFEALGLAWYRAQTERLRHLRERAA